MNLESIIETYGIVLVIAFIIKLVYYVILLSKVSETATETYMSRKNLDNIYEILITLERKSIEQTKLLKRIAKALETENEPYIIERKESPNHAFSVNGEKENRP
ncbi:hypothetical protein [Faecalibacillus faecis]|jgi:hypothetical protein|uniref:hypothetical protein n=1 Tax=Faecalibacillus faecis TaxID=1982628 RepID=UPI003FD8C869